jgi:uncharacterized cupin superfamily protein
MKYVRIISTEDGKSSIEHVETRVAPVDFIPGQPALDLSVPEDAKSAMFIRTPAGWSGGWHPTPRRQFVFGIEGTLEFEAADGQTCLVRPGKVVLLEDTTGTGHHTRVMGDEDWWGVLIGLE